MSRLQDTFHRSLDIQQLTVNKSAVGSAVLRDSSVQKRRLPYNLST